MFGSKRHHLRVTDSTNTFARSLILESAEEGTAVTAEYQTAGRGRHDRVWESNPWKNLLVSFVIYPSRNIEEWGGLPLMTGLAVAETISLFSHRRAMLKWPNDVLVGGKKISGILLESGSSPGPWAVVGIGINVRQKEFGGDFYNLPTSISLEGGSDVTPEMVYDSLCGALDKWYAIWCEEGTHAIAASWKEQTDMLGRPCVYIENGEERTVTPGDINDDGSLSVENTDGSFESLYSGDISIRLRSRPNDKYGSE